MEIIAKSHIHRIQHSSWTPKSWLTQMRRPIFSYSTVFKVQIPDSRKSGECGNIRYYRWQREDQLLANRSDTLCRGYDLAPSIVTVPGSTNIGHVRPSFYDESGDCTWPYVWIIGKKSSLRLQDPWTYYLFGWRFLNIELDSNNASCSNCDQFRALRRYRHGFCIHVFKSNYLSFPTFIMWNIPYTPSLESRATFSCCGGNGEQIYDKQTIFGIGK